MKSYTTIHIQDIPYHYRVSGNSFGWNLYVINDAMLDAKLWTSAGKEVKMPMWEIPKDKNERLHFLHEEVAKIVKKYL